MKLKCRIITTFLLLVFIVYGQDTTYYDIKGKKVNLSEQAHHYKVVLRDPVSTNRKIEQEYSNTGILKSEAHQIEVSRDKEDGRLITKKNGKYKEWYDNGQLYKDIDYKNGKIDGKLITYWEDGSMKRMDNFKRGEFRDGKCFNSDGDIIDHFPYEVIPEFPGGELALFRYISKNSIYPVEMQRMGLKGKVVVRFIVDKDGIVTHVEVVKSASPEFDAEAVRIVKSMPIWMPGIQDGEVVPVYYTLPVVFKLK
jgi:TonB family protein